MVKCTNSLRNNIAQLESIVVFTTSNWFFIACSANERTKKQNEKKEKSCTYCFSNRRVFMCEVCGDYASAISHKSWNIWNEIIMQCHSELCTHIVSTQHSTFQIINRIFEKKKSAYNASHIAIVNINVQQFQPLSALSRILLIQQSSAVSTIFK